MCVWALVAFLINPITTLDTPLLQPQRLPGQVFEKPRKNFLEATLSTLALEQGLTQQVRTGQGHQTQFL